MDGCEPGALSGIVIKAIPRLLEEVSPTVLQLDSRFDTTGRSGSNFSRINRDIRFAKDKTPYRAQMYLKFSAPFPGEGETGQTLRRDFREGGYGGGSGFTAVRSVRSRI